MYFARFETQPTFALANIITLLNNPTMKLNKPLIFTLFLTSAAALPAAQENGIDKNSIENSETTAVNSKTDPADRVMPDLVQQQQKDIAQAQNSETDVIWLESGGQKQLALLQRAITSRPVGSILIFPDRSTSADWPSIVHPLRTQLPEYNWNTLSITLPGLPSEVVPQRTLPALQDNGQIQTSPNLTNGGESEPTADPAQTNGENEASNSDAATAEKNMANYKKLVAELGQQASSQLADVEGDIKIVLGVGEGATWAMHYFMQDTTQPDRFLVLLDPALVMDEHAPNLLQMISEAKVPILDLWFDNNSIRQQRAELRKRTARRNGNQGYRQIRLNLRSNDPRKEPLWLTRQLRGILKTHILDAQKPAQPAAEAMELTPGSGQFN